MTRPAADLPIDPDLDGGPFPGARPGRWPRLAPRVLVAVFAGGVAGGLARYAITSAWPTADAGFPWATFTVNTGGALLLPLIIAVLAEVWSPRRYLRPLLGTGFLGAFTTFSSVMTSTGHLAAHGHARTAVLYLVGSLLAALGAAALGLVLGQAVAARRERFGTRRR